MSQFLPPILNAGLAGFVIALSLVLAFVGLSPIISLCAAFLREHHARLLVVFVLTLGVSALAGCNTRVANCIKGCGGDSVCEYSCQSDPNAWYSHQIRKQERERERKWEEEQDRKQASRLGRLKCEGSEMEEMHKLHFAAKIGDLGAVRQMLDSGMDIEEQCGDSGKTPLHMAAEANASEVVSELLDRGADTEARLPSLSSFGYSEDFDRASGMTALHLAAEADASDAIVEIVSRGGNIEAVDELLHTPLHYAAEENAAKAAVALVGHGANLEARNTTVQPERGGPIGHRTPLHAAARKNALQVLTVLLDNGANMEAATFNGVTPLHIAVGGGALETASELVKRGADVNAADKFGKTPLALALEEGHYELANQMQEADRQARKTPQEKPKSEFASAETKAGGVFEAIWRSVVVVESGNSQGSGVALKPNLVATNCHVTDAATSPIVVFKGENRRADRSQSYAARVVAGDRDRDVCLLEAPGLWAIPAETRKAAEMKIAEQVYAVGAPRGLDFSISGGLVSQLREEAGSAAPLIQTDTAISPGSSGGGLFDSSGKLTGLTTFGYRDSEGLNFAVPIEWALELIPETE